MDKLIEIRDFSILLLHYNEDLVLPVYRQSFQIIHRKDWINHPYELEYEPSFKMYLMDDSVEYNEDDPYNGVHLCLCGKGSFTIKNPDGITPNNLAQCLMEISKKMTEYTVENKEKFNLKKVPVYPQLSEVLEEARKFLTED